MNVLEIIGEFFLIEWMWSVSWGISQAPIAFFIMSLLLWIFARLSFIRAVLSALLVTTLTFLIFSACIMLGLGILSYAPTSDLYEYALSGVHWESFIGFGLAGIFSLMEIVFLRRVHSYTRVSMLRLTIITCVSNGVAALITRAFLLTP